MLDALSSFKQAREQGTGKVQLTGVAAKIAQENAYKQFIDENLGIARQGQSKKDKKQTFIEQVEQDAYIASINLDPAQTDP